MHLGRLVADHIFSPDLAKPYPGTLGTAIDVPLGHKDAAFVRSHFDAVEARVSDAPRAGEIVVLRAYMAGEVATELELQADFLGGV